MVPRLGRRKGNAQLCIGVGFITLCVISSTFGVLLSMGWHFRRSLSLGSHRRSSSSVVTGREHSDTEEVFRQAKVNSSTAPLSGHVNETAQNLAPKFRATREAKQRENLKSASAGAGVTIGTAVRSGAQPSVDGENHRDVLMEAEDDGISNVIYHQILMYDSFKAVFLCGVESLGLSVARNDSVLWLWVRNDFQEEKLRERVDHLVRLLPPIRLLWPRCVSPLHLTRQKTLGIDCANSS